MRFQDVIVETKIRLGTGKAWIGFVQSILLFSASIKSLFSLTLLQTVIWCIIGIVFVFFVGWFVLDFTNLQRRESELSTGKYNPYFKKKLGD